MMRCLITFHEMPLIAKSAMAAHLTFLQKREGRTNNGWPWGGHQKYEVACGKSDRQGGLHVVMRSLQVAGMHGLEHKS